MRATLPPEVPYSVYRSARDQFAHEVGPFIEQKCRLQSMYSRATFPAGKVEEMKYEYPEWVERSLEALDGCIETIMYRIAREHGLDTIENISC